MATKYLPRGLHTVFEWLEWLNNIRNTKSQGFISCALVSAPICLALQLTTLQLYLWLLLRTIQNQMHAYSHCIPIGPDCPNKPSIYSSKEKNTWIWSEVSILSLIELSWLGTHFSVCGPQMNSIHIQMPAAKLLQTVCPNTSAHSGATFLESTALLEDCSKFLPSLVQSCTNAHNIVFSPTVTALFIAHFYRNSWTNVWFYLHIKRTVCKVRSNPSVYFRNHRKSVLRRNFSQATQKYRSELLFENRKVLLQSVFPSVNRNSRIDVRLHSVLFCFNFVSLHIIPNLPKSHNHFFKWVEVIEYYRNVLNWPAVTPWYLQEHTGNFSVPLPWRITTNKLCCQHWQYKLYMRTPNRRFAQFTGLGRLQIEESIFQIRHSSTSIKPNCQRSFWC